MIVCWCFDRQIFGQSKDREGAWDIKGRQLADLLTSPRLVLGTALHMVAFAMRGMLHLRTARRAAAGSGVREARWVAAPKEIKREREEEERATDGLKACSTPVTTAGLVVGSSGTISTFIAPPGQARSYSPHDATLVRPSLRFMTEGNFLERPPLRFFCQPLGTITVTRTTRRAPRPAHRRN